VYDLPDGSVFSDLEWHLT